MKPTFTAPSVPLNGSPASLTTADAAIIAGISESTSGLRETNVRTI